MELPARAATGLLIALGIAVAARRARSLDGSGAAAATALGTLAIAAGWGWGALLIVYFVSSSALSRWRRAEKAARTGAVVEKAGPRDARQVLANGGAFAVACAGALLSTTPHALLVWGAAGAGALTASAADTWATEVGTAVGGVPRALLGGRRVAPGTSGAVSVAGTTALVAGALFVALTARLLGVAPLGSALVAGVAGAVGDTLLGAVVQERRWCERCAAPTERRVHDCGTRTRRVGGLAAVDNDVVNVACTAIGAAVGAAMGAAVA